MDLSAGVSLTPNEILALWAWNALMLLATLLSWGNAMKNSGKPLANVWFVMSAVCGWWLLSGIVGLMGANFILLRRIGIAALAVAAFVLYRRGDFRTGD
jgi:hypothetical protein